MDKDLKSLQLELERLNCKIDKFTGMILVPYRISQPANLIKDLNKIKSMI